MITNFLLDNPVLVPVAFLLIAIFCAVAGHLLLRARRHGRRILWMLVVLSVAPVFALTLGPVPGRTFVVCVVQFALPTLGSVELLANVALFFPLVFFATLATRRPVLVLAAGTGLSAVIEAVQAALHDIGRSCDTNDWFMNTIGVALGVLAAVATIALGNRRMPAAPGA
jgi:hypothetical protein